MNLRDVSTTDLVKELARRAEHFDALASLAADVHGGAGREGASRTVADGARRPRALDAETVVAVLAGAGRPLTVLELHRRLRRGTRPAVTAQLRRLQRAGKVKVHGAAKPHAYGLA